MLDHLKIRDITNDVYNNFYLKVRHLDYSDESWKIRVDMGKELMKKYNNDRLCIDLVNGYLSVMQRDHEMEIKQNKSPDRSQNIR